MTQRAARPGRPLRFLLIVMLCWMSGRLAMTRDWAAIMPSRDALPTQVAVRAMPTARAASARFAQVVAPMPRAHPVPAPHRAGDQALSGGATGAPSLLDYLDFSVAFANRRHKGGPEAIADTPGRGMNEGTAQFLPATPFASPAASPARWSASAWLFWREAASGQALAGVGQLGGPQAGARIGWQLLPGQPDRLTLYARATTALRAPQSREAALGIAFQPMQGVPLRLTVERRADLGKGGRNAFAASMIGGFGPTPVAGDATAEAYAQAGIVGARSRDAFIDGKLSMMHPLPGIRPVTAGFALSGGAQPRLARIDIGPQIEARVKLGDSPARISAEWRERIAGRAQPGSGIAVTLATDF